MSNFNRGNRGGRGGDFGRRDFRDRGPRGPVTMHKAICDNCGKECEVPFRPTSGKPIFCSSCFENNRGSDSRNSGGRNFDRPQSQYKQAGYFPLEIKQQFEQLNSKLDKILNILLPIASEVEKEIEVNEVVAPERKTKRSPKKAS